MKYIILATVIGLLALTLQSNSLYAQALQACHTAHNDITSTDSVIQSKWQACYKAETASNTEFICNHNNTVCVLESK